MFRGVLDGTGREGGRERGRGVRRGWGAQRTDKEGPRQVGVPETDPTRETDFGRRRSMNG